VVLAGRLPFRLPLRGRSIFRRRRPIGVSPSRGGALEDLRIHQSARVRQRGIVGCHYGPSQPVDIEPNDAGFIEQSEANRLGTSASGHIGDEQQHLFRHSVAPLAPHRAVSSFVRALSHATRIRRADLREKFAPVSLNLPIGAGSRSR
jgi:hypothetical protein